MKLPKLIATILILTGLLVLFALPIQGGFPDRVLRLGEHLGVAIVIAGLIAFAIETERFTEYFEERLSRILMRRGFVELLDPDSLRGVQETITARLLGYELQEDMQKLYGDSNALLLRVMSEPYRRNYVADVTISDAKDLPDTYLVHEVTSYELRANKAA